MNFIHFILYNDSPLHCYFFIIYDIFLITMLYFYYIQLTTIIQLENNLHVFHFNYLILY